MANLILVKTTEIDDKAVARAAEEGNRIGSRRPSARLCAVLTLTLSAEEAAGLGGFFLENAGWRLHAIGDAPELEPFALEECGLSLDQVITAALELPQAGLSGPPVMCLAEVLSGTPLPAGLSAVAALSAFIREVSPEIELTREDVALTLPGCRIEAVFGRTGIRRWKIKEEGRPEITSAGAGKDTFASYLAAVKNIRSKK